MTTLDPMNVQRGQRLQEIRKAAGLLQRQVGAEFDIDKAAVSEWEKGKSSPDRRKLQRLDDLYNAKGEVLRLYGIDTSAVDEVSRLRDEVRDEVGELWLALKEVARLVGVTLDASQRPVSIQLAQPCEQQQQ